MNIYCCRNGIFNFEFIFILLIAIISTFSIHIFSSCPSFVWFMAIEICSEAVIECDFLFSRFSTCTILCDCLRHTSDNNEIIVIFYRNMVYTFDRDENNWNWLLHSTIKANKKMNTVLSATHTHNVHALEEKNTQRNESTKQNRRKFDCVLITQTYELGKNIGNACNLIDRRH